MFRKVSAVVLVVQDFPTCLAFYRDTLGLEVAVLEENMVAFEMKDHKFAMLNIAGGASLIGVDESVFAKQAGNIGRTVLCAELEDVDAAYETLMAKGVPFTKGPTTQFWGIRAAYFRDPDGNVWEIYHNLPQ